jgi:hypothetical protein
MVRSSQKEQTLANQESLPTPSQAPQERQVSLVGPPAQVRQWGPVPDMVIGEVEPTPAMQPDPIAVATYGDDGSITIN